MAHFYGLPVKVKKDRKGRPVSFVWRGVTYEGEIIGSWKLSTRWWEPKAYSDRTYFRIETADHQIFELYCDAAKDGLWVLARIQD
jgi:hypothetical protein